MCHAHNEAVEKRNGAKNRTAKSEKHQNSSRIGKLNHLGILEADTIKHAEKKEKMRKVYLR